MEIKNIMKDEIRQKLIEMLIQIKVKMKKNI